MVAEKFQIYSVKITGKYICETKNWIYSFLFVPRSKTLPQVFIITPQAEGNYPFLPNCVLWRSIFSPAERAGRIMDLKKIKPTRILATSFDKFHHLYNIYIFGFCFVVQKFSFKHAEVWRFFILTNKFFTKK